MRKPLTARLTPRHKAALFGLCTLNAIAPLTIAHHTSTVGHAGRGLERSRPEHITDRPPIADTLASFTAGMDATCATTTTGAAFCWGDIARIWPRQHDTLMQMTGIDARPAFFHSMVSSGASSMAFCAIGAHNTVWCSDAYTSNASVNPRCFAVACLAPVAFTDPAAVSRRYTAVARGSSHTCALAENGAAYCWGGNESGQQGTDTLQPNTSQSPHLQPVAGGYRFTQISAGNQLTCGIAVPDAGVYCWGHGGAGATGDPHLAARCTRHQITRQCVSWLPVRVFRELLPEDEVGTARIPWFPGPRFTRVSVGMQTACGVTEDGAVFCWGSNDTCMLGRCPAPDSPRAHQIQVPGYVVDIGLGATFACARTRDGRIFCWGANIFGELGSYINMNARADGTIPDYRSPTLGRSANEPCIFYNPCFAAPVAVEPGRRWTALAVGQRHSCALAADDGAIYCWGHQYSNRPASCDTLATSLAPAQCHPAPVRIADLPRFAVPKHHSPTDSVTRVIVNRYEARFIFPRDTMHAWGWSERDATWYPAKYGWEVLLPGSDFPARLLLHIQRTDGQTREFSSLNALVATRQPLLCYLTAREMRRCSSNGVSAAVEDGHVTLTIRDSATIFRLFALHPPIVRAMRERPELPSPYLPERSANTATVTYEEPAVPLASATFRADATHTRRQYEAQITTIERRIISFGLNTPMDQTIWLSVGDSVQLTVSEWIRRSDSDVLGGFVTTDSAWMIRDRSIIRLLPPTPRKTQTTENPSPSITTIIARRPGRTTIRIAGIHGKSDSMPTHGPVPSVLTRDIIVTASIASVHLSPRPESVRAGDSITFAARVRDKHGRILQHAPVFIAQLGGPGLRAYNLSRAIHFDFPGRYTLLAYFGNRADTLIVRVDSVAH